MSNLRAKTAIFVLGIFALSAPAGGGEEPQLKEGCSSVGVAGMAPDSLLPPPALSMGQPSRSRLVWAPLAGYQGESGRFAGRLTVDATRGELFPILGWLELTGEGKLGLTGSRLDPALGVYAGIPLLMAGVDYDFHDRRFPFGISAQFPLQRGGLLGKGDRIRIDYRPSDREVLLGLVLRSPFESYRMTRPRSRGIRIPPGSIPRRPVAASLDTLPGGMEATMQEVEHAVAWLDRLLTPKFDPGDGFQRSAQAYLEHVSRKGHGFWEEDSTYHHGLDALFTEAAGGDSAFGAWLACRAESVLFEDVIVPFDGKFCQIKEPSHAGGYCKKASAAFAEILDRQPRFAAGRDGEETTGKELTEEIYRRVLRAIERASVDTRARWKQSVVFWHRRTALAWLPLNYGLRREQYDSQPEWDAVLAHLTGQPYTETNSIEYLMFEQFHLRIKNMIRETRYYQVTIVHDFRGWTPGGDPDIYGWDMVVDGYLAAFRQAVAEIKGGGRKSLPQFFLFLDENYYKANRSRGIVSYLENLFDGPSPRLHNRQIEEQIKAAHHALRDSIDACPALKGLSREQLEQAFKVNVNVTNPFDLAFFQDVTRRDHRKIGFRDVSEEYPDSGLAIFTGQGIGEHYNGGGWEDRSILVRGTCLVQLKSATRDLFLGQGFKETEVPEYLRPRPYPPEYESRCRELMAKGWTTPVSLTTNRTGYGRKEASVFKAAVYNLAPPQSVILSFDSLWTSEYWASMFICAAVRGTRIYVVAPTPNNAPSHATPTMYYLRRNLGFLLQARVFFDQSIAARHGVLHVGIYAHEAAVDELGERIKLFAEGWRKTPFLNVEFPFASGIDSLLLKEKKDYSRVSKVGLRLRPYPLLHLKTQLFGTREAFEMTDLPEWGPVLVRHIEVRQAQLDGCTNSGIVPSWHRELGLPAALHRKLQAEGNGADGRSILTFSIGSHNQDPRSQFLDGESLIAVSGEDGLITAIDFMFILGIASWPDSLEDLDRLFPPVHPGLLKPLYGLIEDQT